MNQTLLLIWVDQNYKYSRKGLCDELRKLAIPKLIKESFSKIELYEEKIGKLATLFPLKYLSMFEQIKKIINIKTIIFKKQNY